MEKIHKREGFIITREELCDFVEDSCLEACVQLYDKNIRTISSNGNIQYAMSPANWDCDDRNGLFIHIDYDSLSEDNKKVANELQKQGKVLIRRYDGEGAYGGIKTVLILIYKPKTLPGQRPVFNISKFKQYIDSVVNLFDEQDVLYGTGTINDAILQIKNVERIKDEKELNEFLSNKGIIDLKGDINIQNLIFLLNSYNNAEVIENDNDAGYRTINIFKVYDPETGTFWVNEELLQKHKEFINKNNYSVKK